MYLGDNACLMNEISQKIRDNNNLYEELFKIRPFRYRFTYSCFSFFNLGDDYIAYIGMNWPEMKKVF